MRPLRLFRRSLRHSLRGWTGKGTFAGRGAEGRQGNSGQGDKVRPWRGGREESTRLRAAGQPSCRNEWVRVRSLPRCESSLGIQEAAEHPDAADEARPGKMARSSLLICPLD